VPIRSLPDGAPDWEEIAADMLRVMADLADPNDNPTNGRFNRESPEVLEEMCKVIMGAWHRSSTALASATATANCGRGRVALGAETDRALPHWPRRMKLRFAAAYVDESETKFLQGVKAGKWPQGSRDGGNVYWFIEDLDAALDRLKPVGAKGREADGWGDYLDGET
jgi:hypothetical protein